MSSGNQYNHECVHQMVVRATKQQSETPVIFSLSSVCSSVIYDVIITLILSITVPLSLVLCTQTVARAAVL